MMSIDSKTKIKYEVVERVPTNPSIQPYIEILLVNKGKAIRFELKDKKEAIFLSNGLARFRSNNLQYKLIKVRKGNSLFAELTLKK